ncbi:LLM class flavin-dependent oxidoreductase [Lacticaseibacillus pabuli]|uniref:LLM class flavin-dependent oxidoreductase n=1 Tax=Lacticaseibacillus pabuli TaxID=3025672 RepID=A0ABY7WV17_9LACO|nr:LLM class flavin-dependent oxidoreductase [Lacticaseibacillus sp. KACC 23028]WDF82899.1 LLM class flavin-dependent oxidoreductase [Lacticaseibacillus sp. KACC 23028]
MADKKYTFGLDTFGDLAFHDDGTQMNGDQTLQQVVKEAKLADDLGIDLIALGEHHRPEFAISSPEVVLGAMAAVTKNIKLGTAVTVLSSDDPVRVFERFSTLHGLSGGREQIMLGRGSFTESFPLYGYDLEKYNELFEEKIAMWDELLKHKPMNWNGKLTQKLTNTKIFPLLPKNETIDTVVGVGGSPESIVRAVYYDFPVMIAIIGGEPTRFRPYVDLYHRAVAEYKKTEHPLGMHSHGIILEDAEEAKEVGWKYIRAEMDRIGIDRGWAPMTRDRFEFEIDKGSYYVGTPEQVAQKLAKNMKALDMSRFDLVYGTGGQLQHEREETIRNYGEKVIPRVKELLGGE